MCVCVPARRVLTCVIRVRVCLECGNATIALLVCLACLANQRSAEEKAVNMRLTVPGFLGQVGVGVFVSFVTQSLSGAVGFKDC